MRAIIGVAVAGLLAAGCDDGGGETVPEPIECSIVSPASDVLVGGTVTVEVTVSGPAGEVRLLADGSQVAQRPVDGESPVTVALSWDTAGADGTVELVARAAADDGRSDDSDPVTVRVDNLPPTAAFGLRRYALLAGAAEIPLSVEEANPASIRIEDGDVVIHAGTEVVDAVTWDVTELEDGIHRLSLVVTDVAGRSASVEEFPVIVANHGEEMTVTYDPSARVFVPPDWETAEYHTRVVADARPRVRRLISWLTWDASTGWAFEYTVGQGLCPHRGIAYTSDSGDGGEILIDLGRDALSRTVVNRFPEEDRTSTVFPYNTDPLTFGAFFGHADPLSPETHVGDHVEIEAHYVLLFEPAP